MSHGGTVRPTYLPRSCGRVVRTQQPFHSSFSINRHRSHTKYIHCSVSERAYRGRIGWMRGVTHNVNELLYFTLTLRPNLPHLQRDKRAKLVPLCIFLARVIVSREPNKYRAHICEYLGCKCFPDLPEDLTSPRRGDAPNVTVSLSRLVKGFMQLFGRCLELNGN